MTYIRRVFLRVFSSVLVLMLMAGLCACASAAAAETPAATQAPTTAQAPATAQAPEPPEQIALDSLSLEQLLALRQRVEDELLARAYVPYYDIERGAKGEEVSRLQERLTELGFYAGRITGKLDTETQKAIKLFEKANGQPSDGLPSREDQALLYSPDAAGKNTPAPTPAPQTPDATEDPYAAYGAFDYTDAMRYPEMHYGEKVRLSGSVLQVLGSRNEGFEIRFATSGSDNVVYVFVQFDPGYNLLEDDRLTVYATLHGTVTYESIMGQQITLPAAYADAVVLR